MAAMRTPLLLVLAASLCAQDAGMVLMQSVVYGTQKSTLPMDEAQRKEADRLQMEARKHGASGDFAKALRSLHQGMAVMRGVEWSPLVEAAAAMEVKPDHAIGTPAGTIRVNLKPLYSSERVNGQTLLATVVLAPAGNGSAGGVLLLEKHALAATGASVEVKLPEKSGSYFLETRLTGPDGETDAKSGVFRKQSPFLVASLQAERDRLAARLTKARSNGAGRGLATAEYALELYGLADRGETNPHRYRFEEQFASAHGILDALEAGKDPFAGKRGDLSKAYRSDVDGTLQPYRVFVPESYEEKKATPLVIALHGMGGNESSFFTGYDGVLLREAARKGFLVAAPKGRAPTSMYRGTAEKDVLDVLVEVRRDYNVDGKRIYLMGHSMGGFGTWSIAMNHPELFAALGPIAGGGNAGGMEKIKHIPQFVVHGDNDPTVNVEQSRAMVEAGRKAGAAMKYVEVKGGGHGNIVVPNLGPMLDYFEKQSKP
ncbi:MAG: prolyl oligopeptidase family serine peptidase [Bryobacterales bacterium]|nr:prolyl oligopeptidase family serine peptidase [Bryobacterales bacterium]